MEGQRAAQREATVSALVTEARQRFARDGYTSVRIDGYRLFAWYH